MIMKLVYSKAKRIHVQTDSQTLLDALKYSTETFMGLPVKFIENAKIDHNRGTIKQTTILIFEDGSKLTFSSGEIKVINEYAYRGRVVKVGADWENIENTVLFEGGVKQAFVIPRSVADHIENTR